MTAATTASSSSYAHCPICFGSGDGAANPKGDQGDQVIFFPSPYSGIAHEKCFEVIKTPWKEFYKVLESSYGDAAGLKHSAAIALLYGKSLKNLGVKPSTLLTIAKDPKAGENVVKSLFNEALSLLSKLG